MDSLAALFLVLFLIAALVAVGIELRRRRLSDEAQRAYAARAEALATCADMESQAARASGYLAALGDASTDALLVLDRNRNIVWANQSAWNMFNDGQPALNHTFITLVRDFELNQAVTDATAGHRPMVRQTAVGSRSMRIYACPISEYEGAAVTIEDVTELQRLGRARRDFVANISHELRTPLANIDLAAQTLRQPGVDEALARRMLDQIQVQVQTLSQLSQEMLELAQIESGQVLLKLVPTPLEQVVRRSLAHLLPQAAVKKQQLTLRVPEDLLALVDEEQVSRVISNLVHNAVKFTPDGGTITVQAEAEGEDIRVCVSDTGPGIPKDERDRVFERFYKADRARTKGGTGLGLAIAKHIIEGHGGRIWIESRPGPGATFCFTVPRA
jgi:two-component system, OmpR family, phosphate regulon sensor histidine kinase PhoR